MPPTTDPVIKAVLAELVGPDAADRWAGAYTAAAKAADLQGQRLEHFLAQTLYETAGLRRLEENLNYTPERLLEVFPRRFSEASARSAAAAGPAAIAEIIYGGRLGNTHEGDGYHFRGRGLLMLTGRANYSAYASDVDAPHVLANPDLVSEPPHAALTAAWYWRRRGINTFADRDDLEAVTAAINGGFNGLADRAVWLDKATRAHTTAQTVMRSGGRPLLHLGEHAPLVLHDLTESDHRALLRAWLDGERSVVLTGAWYATRTSTGDAPETPPKLDIRRKP